MLGRDCFGYLHGKVIVLFLHHTGATPRHISHLVLSQSPKYPHYLYHVLTLAGCHVAPVVVPPPPLNLLMSCLRLAICCHLFLLSTPPPGCLLFAGRLPCLILLYCLQLASPLIVLPPHLSILNPLPLFAMAGCCIASCCAASASCPLINTATSQWAAALRCARNPTFSLPLVCLNWLPCCLLWHLCLTSASLPFSLPLPLSASYSCPPQLVVCVASHQPATLQPPLSITSPTHDCLVRLLPAPLSLIAVAWPLLMLCHRLLFCLSWASCLASCCIASPHTTTSHLPVTMPLIAPLPIKTPLSTPLLLVPLVQLVVVLPLLTPLPAICWHLCLSSRHGLPCLLSSWLLHCLSSCYCLPSAGNLCLSLHHCLLSLPSSCHCLLLL